MNEPTLSEKKEALARLSVTLDRIGDERVKRRTEVIVAVLADDIERQEKEERERLPTWEEVVRYVEAIPCIPGRPYAPLFAAITAVKAARDLRNGIIGTNVFLETIAKVVRP